MKRKTKDRLGTIFGLGMAIGTGLTGIGALVPNIPQEITAAGVIIGTMSGAMMGWVTGKKTTP